MTWAIMQRVDAAQTRVCAAEEGTSRPGNLRRRGYTYLARNLSRGEADSRVRKITTEIRQRADACAADQMTLERQRQQARKDFVFDTAKLTEPQLANDYPVYADRMYLVDGKPYRSDYHDIPVRDLRHHLGATTVCRFDIYGRQDQLRAAGLLEDQ